MNGDGPNLPPADRQVLRDDRFNNALLNNVVLTQAEQEEVTADIRNIRDLRETVTDNLISLVISGGSTISAIGSLIASLAAVYLAYRIYNRDSQRLQEAEAELAKDIAIAQRRALARRL